MHGTIEILDNIRPGTQGCPTRYEAEEAVRTLIQWAGEAPSCAGRPIRRRALGVKNLHVSCTLWSVTGSREDCHPWPEVPARGGSVVHQAQVHGAFAHYGPEIVYRAHW